MNSSQTLSRTQRVVLWILVAALLVAGVVWLRMRQKARDHLSVMTGPLAAHDSPESPVENISLLLANDVDGSMATEAEQLPLPKDSTLRARSILNALLAEYASPRSTHPIAGPPATAKASSTAGPSTDEDVEAVYLIPLKTDLGASGGSNQAVTAGRAPDLLAVVDLSASFAARHPSGIEPETLTLLSIIETLHANQPRIAQVRFLVDGRQHDTLAGHADLTRVYLASNSLD